MQQEMQSREERRRRNGNRGNGGNGDDTIGDGRMGANDDGNDAGEDDDK